MVLNAKNWSSILAGDWLLAHDLFACSHTLSRILVFRSHDWSVGIKTNQLVFVLAILRLFDGEFLPPRFILFFMIAKRPLLCSFDLRRMLEYLRVSICSRRIIASPTISLIPVHEIDCSSPFGSFLSNNRNQRFYGVRIGGEDFLSEWIDGTSSPCVSDSGKGAVYLYWI